MQYKFSNKEFNCDIDFRLENARFTLVSMAQYLITTKMTHVPHGTVVALENIFLSSPETPASAVFQPGLYVEVGLSEAVYLGDVLFDSIEAYDRLVHRLGVELTFQFIGISSRTANELPASRQALTTAVALELQDHLPFKAPEEIDRVLGNNALTFQHSHDRTFIVAVSWLQEYDIAVGTISVKSTESLAMMGIGKYVDNEYVFADKTFIDLEVVAVPEQKFIDVDVNTLPDSFPWGPPHSHEPERTVLHVTLDPEDPNPIGTVEEIITPLLTMANKMADIKNSVNGIGEELKVSGKPGALTIIAGLTHSGRSTLALQLAIEHSRTKRVAYYNDETTLIELHNQALILSEGLTSGDSNLVIVTGNPTPKRLVLFYLTQFEVCVIDVHSKPELELSNLIRQLLGVGIAVIVVTNNDLKVVKEWRSDFKVTSTSKGRDNDGNDYVVWNTWLGEKRFFNYHYHRTQSLAYSAINLKTSQFKPASIVFNDRDFYVAVGKWSSGNSEDLACRYHTSGNLGYPNGMGKPQWFRLPATMKDVIVENVESLMIQFKKSPLSVEVGQWIRTQDGSWHLATYVYGNEEMVSAIGLGKADDYPILIKEIVEVRKAPSALHKYHRGRVLLWHTNGYVFLTFEEIGSWGQSISPENGRYYKRFVHRKVDGKWACGEQVSLAYFYQLANCDLLMELDELPHSISEFMAPIDIQLLLNRTKVKVRFPVDADAVSDMDSYFGEESYNAYL